MNITILHAHWFNRGDEAALRAMVDEISYIYPTAQIHVQILGQPIWFPTNKNVRLVYSSLPAGKRFKWLDYYLRYYTNGLIGLKKSSKEFVETIKHSDIILHAPGGPSIGDIYSSSERGYLARLNFVRKLHVPYAFYAPSMGPFYNKKNSRIRKKVLKSAKFIAVREGLSKQYLMEYGFSDKDVIVTLDSAFQHEVDIYKYGAQFSQDSDLQIFLSKYKKTIGITITDLQWNPKYKGDIMLQENISSTFREIIAWLSNQGYGIIFIPQLFGNSNDVAYMSSFCNSNTYILPVIQANDCYYQQYVIQKLYAVIGMRYHSNIFSAKMGTPFISISYEQKMIGFMQKASLETYCIDITKLSFEKLVEKFELLCTKYDMYRAYLKQKHNDWREESYATTNLVKETVSRIMRSRDTKNN